MLRKLSYIFSFIVGGIYIFCALLLLIATIMTYYQAAQTGSLDAASGIIGNANIKLFLTCLVFGLAYFAIRYGIKVLKAHSKQELKVMSIFSLFLLGILPGLFCLVSDDSEYDKSSKNNTNVDAKNSYKELTQNTIDQDDFIEKERVRKLKKLDEIYDKKLISEEEYNEKRKNINGDLWFFKYNLLY